jgi:LPS-assembly protein
MLRLSLSFILCVLCHWAVGPASAHAQINITGCKSDALQSQISIQHDANHWTLTGTAARPIQIDCDDMQLFANSVEVFQTEGRLVATGDVAFISGESRISAERLDYDTKAKTGIFYNFSGTTVLRDKAEPGPYGAQEPNAFFWGDELHRQGPKKYRIVRGGFTACVQPTPRWDVGSGSITLNLDDYALLRNAIFRVKGVPVLYLPIFYYPMEEDDRSTGFLMPIYGSSTLRGQSISTPFFWAIGRSHDATISYDWFSKAGQAITGEYRYMLAPGSSGHAAVNMLNEGSVTAENADPTQPVGRGQRSYTVNGSVVQALPRGLRAQANANYFSSLATQQRYQQDVYQATTRQRNFDATLTGSWAEYSLSARTEQRDYFDNNETLTRTGSFPRINLSRAERPIAGSPIYFGASAEYVNILRSTRRNDLEVTNQGLTRMDFAPSLRIPLRPWPFLTANSSIAWRGTYWTESLDAAGRQIEDSIGRQYFDLQTNIVGPSFNRIFNTPGNAYAEKFKHVVEPSLSIQRTTAIEEFPNIVRLESGDYTVGNVTRFTYGLANMLYAKKESSREIARINVSQTYYTDENAAQYDRNYQSTYSGQAVPSKFSAVAVTARMTPTDQFQGEFRTEWDPTVHTLKTLSASGTLRRGEQLQLSGSWSRRRFIPELPDFSDPNGATHTASAGTTLRSRSNRVGGTYSFDYDFQRDYFLQQRVLAYYNAQCCGVVLEFQTFNFQGVQGVSVPQDKRFNISFSLAGIGTFSNFLGALGGAEQRR